MDAIEKRLAELGITLPPPGDPIATYTPALVSEPFLFLSGHVPRKDGIIVSGTVGKDVTEREANAIAQSVALDLLSSANAILGSLDRIARIIKVVGMVHCTSDFTAHSSVINGASELLLSVFGTRGEHVRSAFGVTQLPLNAVLEIEMVCRVYPLSPASAKTTSHF